MVKMCELSINVRQEIISRISTTMATDYQIDRESIDEFWDTLVIGTEARKRT